MRLTKGEILDAVADDDWQSYRLYLKGLSTEDKLDKLCAWLVKKNFSHRAKIQVQNYVNALKRAGQVHTLRRGTLLQEELED
jgi:hypothetical protein